MSGMIGKWRTAWASGLLEIKGMNVTINRKEVRNVLMERIVLSFENEMLARDRN